MALYDNGKPEDILLFIRNFDMTIEASGTLVSLVKIQYLCTLVHGEVLHQFYTFSAKVGSTTSENLKLVILGLGTYFCMLTRCKQKSMLRRTKNFCS